MADSKSKKPKKQGFSLQGYDAKSYKQTEAYTSAIDALYNQAVQEFAALAGKVSVNPQKPFTFADYPATQAKAQQIVNQLASKMQAVIVKGSRDQWLYACKKNDDFLKQIMNTSALNKKTLAKFQNRNLDALKAFQGRKINGLDLSKRIWNYTGQMKTQMELGIDIAVGEGKSAASLSRDLRKYLVDPDKLFHKVKDKHGNLVLSKNAKAFNPGQGKYRSSYKNAMRLTRSEINMAYRESDQLRWQQLDFVIGFEVKLSNNHTTLINGIPTPFKDICDELAGKYPKWFKFKGWHPQCRCSVVPIMQPRKEMGDDMVNELKAALKGDEYKKFESPSTIRDVPDNFKQYAASKEEASKNWKSNPYWIKDNFKGGSIAGGLKVATIAQNKPTKPVKTDEQKTAIQKAWNNRVLRKKYTSELNAIDNKWHEVPSIMDLKYKTGNEIINGTDPKVVDAMVAKLRHKIEVKKSWDAQKPAKKAAALLAKTTKKATNLVTKAEGFGFDGPELQAVKDAIAGGTITNASLNKLYGKLNIAYKKAVSVSKEPLSKEALMKSYSKEDVDSLFAAYDKFYAAKITGQDIGTQMKKLQFEVEWLEKNGKYVTSGVLKKMLERDLVNLKKKFEFDMFKNDADGLILANKSMNDKSVVDKIKALEKALKNKDLDANELKTAIGNAKAAIDEFNSKNIKTISPDDIKFFEDESGPFSITKHYTEAERAKVRDLREKLNDAIRSSKGNIRNSSVRQAQVELTEYMYDIQFNHVAKQQPIKHIGMKLNSKDEFEFDYITDKEAKAAFERYIAASGKGSGYYSSNVGGEHWTSACRQYTKRVKSAGVKITSEATLPSRYFSGSGFINGYIGKNDLSYVKGNQAMQEVLHDYVAGLSYAVSKLPRHNGVTYRGLSYSSEMITRLTACKKGGKPFVHEYGMSTSITPNVADNFGNGITFKIYGRSGIYAREFSAYSSELEVLYRPGSRFEVLEVYQETTGNGIANMDKWTVILKEILK